jgi:hypothetical protein
MPPGAPVCVVKVGWGIGVRYPILVDPAWTTTADMPSKRAGHTALVVDGKLLVAGGRDGNDQVTNTAALYFPATGTWAGTGSMKGARERHAMGLLASVSIKGGAVVTGGTFGGQFLSTVEAYNPVTGQWSDGQTPLVTARADHVAAEVGGEHLVVGGRGTSGVLGTLELVRIYSSLPIQLSMPAARWGHAIATDTVQGVAWVTGGFNPSGVATNSLIRIIVTKSVAVSAQVGMQTARGRHAAAIVKGANTDWLVVLGGRAGESGQSLASVERVDLAKATTGGPWAALADLPAPRHGHGAVALGPGALLTAGGERCNAGGSCALLFGTALLPYGFGFAQG